MTVVRMGMLLLIWFSWVQRCIAEGQFAERFNVCIDNYVSMVEAADMNGDGIQDIVAVGADGEVSQTYVNERGVGVACRLFIPSEPVSLAPSGLIIADLDDNGKNDFVLVSDYFGLKHPRVLVYLAIGDADFEVRNAWSFEIDNFAGFVPTVVSDVDGDGKLDLLAGWAPVSGIGHLTFLKGDGDGGFDVGGEIRIVGGEFGLRFGISIPVVMRMADVDGDDDAELVILARNFRNREVLFIYENLEEVQRGPRWEIPLNLELTGDEGVDYGLTLGNLNGDEFKEIVVSGVDILGGNTVGVFERSGADRFEFSREIKTAYDPKTTLLVDLDEDGVDDIVVQSWKVFQVFLSTEDFMPNDSRVYLTRFGLPATETVRAVDIDNDGDEDLVLPGGWGVVELVRGVGGGDFQVEPFSPNCGDVGVGESGDLDGDGLDDLLTFQPTSVTATMNLCAMKGTMMGGEIAYEWERTFEDETVWHRPAIEDMDKDGYTDVLYCPKVGPESSPPGVAIRYGDSEGRYDEVEFIEIQTDSVEEWTELGARGVRSLDVDLDGHQDLVVTGNWKGFIYVLLGDGKRHFSQVWKFTDCVCPIGLSHEIEVRDINGDEFPDIVASDASSLYPGIWFFSGVGDGTFTANKILDDLAFEGGRPTFAFRVDDFNNDEYLDLVVWHRLADTRVSRLLLFEGGNVLVFGTSPTVILEELSMDGRIYSEDLNRDGNKDLIVLEEAAIETGEWGNRVKVAYGHGDGQFSDPNVVSVGQIDDIKIFDVTGDGTKDLVFVGGGEEHGGIRTQILDEDLDGFPRRFRRGDVDGNGKLEITDPINNLLFQFLGTFQPRCMDATDWDDNGRVETTDAIGSLTYQFGGAGAENRGVLECTYDRTDDDLDCEEYDACTTP